MERRQYLLTLSTAGFAASAGCVTGLFDSKPEAVVLDAPDDQLANSEDLAYPAYGEAFPAFELPDATSDAVIDTGDLDRIAIVTAFYASCPAECGILLDTLARIQHTLGDRGLTDDVCFLPITFDPARDDSEKLRENAENVGVDLDAGNWYNLRPADAEEANAIVSDQLGFRYERSDRGDLSVGYDFTHSVITWLVNPDEVVERAYRGELLDNERVVDDVTTLAEAFADE